MKVKIKRFLALFVAALLLFSIAGFCEKDEKLYEKYGYNENFEYEDEYIGHALKSVVPQIILEYEARIRYRPVQVDSEKFAAQVEIWRGEVSSEQELIDRIKENVLEFVVFGSYKTENVDGAASGSAVIISDDGYIATNAHVAALDEQTKLMIYMYSLDQSVAEDVEEILYDIYENDITISEEDYLALNEAVLYASAANAEVLEEKTKLKACFPTADGDTSYKNGIKYDAELIEIGTQENIEGLTEDTAILKIDAKNLVALTLSETYPETNSSIVAAGFPGAAEEIFSSAGSDASTLSVSTSPGTVSRLVPIDGTDYKAIEITARISGGNSGGPSVDKHLQVEGLNTYALSSDYRFAYMVSAEFVSDLADGLDIEQGEASKTFLTGLQMLQQGYGLAAVNCFERVKDLNKNTPYIDLLIDLAEEAPQTEPATKKEFPVILIIIIAAGVLLLLIIVVSIILAVKSKKRKKAKIARTHTRSYAPATPPVAPASEPVPPANGYTAVRETTQTYTPQNPIQQDVAPQSNAYDPTETAYMNRESATPAFDARAYENPAPGVVPPAPTPESKLRMSSPVEHKEEKSEIDSHFTSASDL